MLVGFPFIGPIERIRPLPEEKWFGVEPWRYRPGEPLPDVVRSPQFPRVPGVISKPKLLIRPQRTRSWWSWGTGPRVGHEVAPSQPSGLPIRIEDKLFSPKVVPGPEDELFSSLLRRALDTGTDFDWDLYRRLRGGA